MRAFAIACLCIVVVLVTFSILRDMTYVVSLPTQSRISAPEEFPRKIIMWYSQPNYIRLNKQLPDLMPLVKCPEKNCFMTKQRQFLATSDALIFSAEHIRQTTLPSRKHGQVWIFHNHEPPFLFVDLNRPFRHPPWSNSFNWTMDFRHDADIVRPYAKLRKREGPRTRNYTAIVGKKTKFVAAMISNCNNWSGRIPYIRELTKHIPVDLYGGCGKNMFKRRDNDKWLKYVSENYRFYLAFENLYCPDYISEKFFMNFNRDLVTVARGGGNYSRDVPPKTFINVADFKSPKELADLLWSLSNNTDMYTDILKRKDNYYYEYELYSSIFLNELYFEQFYEQQPLCDLCERLHNVEKYAKTISNIGPWFQKGVCKKVTTIMPR